MFETVRDICKYVGSQIIDNPICMETGTTHDIRLCNLMHTTTNNITDYICVPKDGILFSFDVDAGHQALGRFACPEDASVVFVYGDSERNLKSMAKLNITVDLLCLDSAEFDTDHAVREYNSIKNSLRPDKHFVLVDDIHNDNSVKYKKIVPILKENGYKYFEANTPTGMFVAFKGYEFPAKP